MKRGFLFMLFAFCGVCTFGQGIPPIGQWRDHLPMRSVLSLASTAESIIAGSAYGYYTYQFETKEISTKTKSNGLSQVGLKLVSKHPVDDLLLVAYQNADLDLLQGDQVRNLPDLMKANVQEDKSINHVSWSGDDALLSLNLGIVVVNTNKAEIKNTYRFGLNGSPIKVFQTAITNGFVYAATAQGLYRADLSSPALNDFRNWLQIPVFNAQSAIQRVVNWNNQLVVQRNDSLFVNRNGNWNFLYAVPKVITVLEVVNNQLFIGHTINNKGSVVLVDPLLNVQEINSIHLTYPTAALFKNGSIWVADLNNGLVNVSKNNELPIFPETPAGLAFGEAVYAKGKILVASGQSSDQPIGFPFFDGIYSFNGEVWSSVNSVSFPVIDSLKEINSVAYNQFSGSIFAGANKGGLLELNGDNKAIVYKQNSFLSPVTNNPTQYSVGGVVVDKEQQLWITNSGAQQGLVVKKTNGGVQKFTIPFTYAGLGLSKLMIDDLDRKWIITSNADGLICFDHGSTIESIGDDRWRHFKQGLGRGNLPSNKVTSIAVDRNGFVWIGTDKGVALIQCGEEVFNSVLCEAILPVVQQDNFAGRLLADETINDIEIDGADRKWIATNNGVWLLSADGQKVVSRFTSINSSLLDNQVYSMVIHAETGEVFFMTKKGICSFRGTATEPLEIKKKPFVFPNPVPPGFSGTIAIRDLPENAWVSITELDGRLVFKTRSLGGQAIWNGKNYKGEPVSSGAYLILVSDKFNTQQLAGKIFFLK